MFINGKMYGSNVTIINGQVISGNVCDNGACKKVDETKKEAADGVNRITIYSNINSNVKVSACNTTDVTAHLYGSVVMGNDLELSVTRFGDEIQISVKSDETSGMSIISGNSIVIGNFSSGSINSLTLDITIPSKSFETISSESKNANIDVASSVNAKAITVENRNGNVDLSATFQTLSIECKSGNVDVDSEAHSDVRLNVTSKNGNVDVAIENIGTSYVSVDSKNGNCKNNPKLRGTYTVSGNITSKNGNVKFC